MTNIIIKEGVILHATDDPIDLTDESTMMEFVPYGYNYPIRVGGGDVNAINAVLVKNINVPIEYENMKYTFSNKIENNPNFNKP